ncbi:MAG: peptidylprolyl isomerase [Planctomycetes bacterium]|nr:peptidylprolyl isomerase [Planctomycetota bacterium]
MQQTVRSVLAAVMVAVIGGPIAAVQPAGGSNDKQPGRQPNAVLVVVNGEPITVGDLEFFMLSRRVQKETRAKLRNKLLAQLIDRRLMRAYLAKRNATPDARAIDAQVKRIHQLIRKQGDDPATVLRKLGFDETRLRAEIALPLAWQVHVRRIITDQQLRDYFRQHRAELDGTEVRASQIFLKVRDDADKDEWNAAAEKLRTVRKEVLDGTISFADAAKRHSAAPSANKGGDVGFFSYRGKMPVEFSRVLFPLKKGAVSEPFRTRFGMHLAMVTDRRPGQLSLEDVRPVVYNALSRQAWDRLVAEQRKPAKIEWKIEAK